MNETTHELDLLGDALQRAWRADHASRVARVRPRRRRLTIVIALTVVLIAAGAAIASSVLKSAADEQQGMLEGYALFKGTHPTCQKLTDTSFSCSLDRPPTEITFYGQDGHPLPNAYFGIKAATVNTHKRVDGGCVATSDDGLDWRCYLGEEAVRRGIIGPNLLGTYLPQPPTA